MRMTSPPPPSPPSGPPRGTRASRRKETQPLPPSPAFILSFASSRNMGGGAYPVCPEKQRGESGIPRQGGRQADLQRRGRSRPLHLDRLRRVARLRQHDRVLRLRERPGQLHGPGAVGQREAVDEDLGARGLDLEREDDLFDDLLKLDIELFGLAGDLALL